MRRVPLRQKPPVDHSSEPGYRAWKKPAWGECEVCGQPGPLERHHVISEQVVRREGGNPWDLRNALELGRHCRCHSRHHSSAQKIPRSMLSEDALAFAAELLGEDVASLYLLRRYGPG